MTTTMIDTDSTVAVQVAGKWLPVICSQGIIQHWYCSAPGVAEVQAWIREDVANDKIYAGLPLRILTRVLPAKK